MYSSIDDTSDSRDPGDSHVILILFHKTNLYLHQHN